MIFFLFHNGFMYVFNVLFKIVYFFFIVYIEMRKKKQKTKPKEKKKIHKKSRV